MFEPKNEMGVIVRFTQVCETLGFHIKEIRAAFPDAIIRSNSGTEYQVEFEFLASNFISHRHDPRKCDIIICWLNDLEEDFPVTVWELSSISQAVVRQIPDEEKELAFLRAENKYLRKQLGVSSDDEVADDVSDGFMPGDFKDYVLELLDTYGGDVALTTITELVNENKGTTFRHSRVKSTWYKYVQLWKQRNGNF